MVRLQLRDHVLVPPFAILIDCASFASTEFSSAALLPPCGVRMPASYSHQHSGAVVATKNLSITPAGATDKDEYTTSLRSAASVSVVVHPPSSPHAPISTDAMASHRVWSPAVSSPAEKSSSVSTSRERCPTPSALRTSNERRPIACAASVSVDTASSRETESRYHGAEVGGHVMHEVDGGVRLDGGPPGWDREQRLSGSSSTMTLTLPPPYQLY